MAGQLLSALLAGGSAILAGIATADLFMGPENGVNSGELPLNVVMGLSPLAVAGATISHGRRRQEEAAENLEAIRGAELNAYVEDAKRLYAPAAAKIEAMPISAEEKAQQLKDLYHMVGEDLMGRDSFKDAAVRIENAEKEIARMPARRLGLAAALATGLAVPVSMVMANDWGAPSMEAGQ